MVLLMKPRPGSAPGSDSDEKLERWPESQGSSEGSSGIGANFNLTDWEVSTRDVHDHEVDQDFETEFSSQNNRILGYN